ncbi:3-deoxy-7-phosphoheptulonate synthase [Nocardiopsis dassonvillei]|uniref:3-deoxy-7-phosphoheptulonate synthase n=1 Tax=Nocardiopsis dassonvillei TaxID=2014 RepID=UPI00313849A3
MAVRPAARQHPALGGRPQAAPGRERPVGDRGLRPRAALAPGPPAGLHLEITPDDVLECAELSDLRARGSRRYRSACDPRLNPRQALRAVAGFGDLLRG